MGRLALTAVFIVTATVLAQEPEGGMGVFPVARPIGNVYDAPYAIGMQGAECFGFVLGRGKVNAAEHEWADGSFNLSEITIAMPRGAVALLRAKDFDGKDAELVLRPIPARELERIR